MKINRPELFRLYMEEINRIADLCEDKSSFSPHEIISILCGILEKKPELIEIDNK